MRIRKGKKNTSTKKVEKEIIPSEKWLVSFKNNNNNKNKDMTPQIIIRQFYAQGYFEAYDIVRTLSEKLDLEVIWFKEKRNCSSLLINKTFPILESICVYCNRIFNGNEPIPCIHEKCIHIFCSLDCRNDHYRLKHSITKK
ncbi:MAG TPA: hypothetical protein VJ583_02595 [Nitrososphaeraceae archaeon]|nr:hypothetical protein [Nitrososphaeraceae archaeon]